MLKCLICTVSVGVHEHHVVPRAYGGINGPVVPLCGTHHTLVHTLALKKNSLEREKLLAGHTAEQKEKINQLVLIIRRARISAKQFQRPITIQIQFDLETSSMLRQLKHLLGARSLQQTLIRSIHKVYKYEKTG